jgi:quinol monooxygenase YgiN
MQFATLDPSAGYTTIINTYEVEPGRADALLNLLARATAETIRFLPGFVSASFHVNFDRTQIVNYAQWTNREAIAAARVNAAVAAQINEAAKIAKSFNPIPYELRHTVLADRV